MELASFKTFDKEDEEILLEVAGTTAKRINDLNMKEGD
jgi:hypothetical protein